MKRIFLLAIILSAFNSSFGRQPYAVGMSFDVFYTNLSPYGEWIEIDRGVVVWRPAYVNYDWQPYTNGRWVYTDHGWYWDSYEEFGWATAHYGRWFNDDYYGWIWFPDYEWGPAWVEWRHGNNHVGWAPLPPYAKFSRNNGIRFSVTWNSPHKHWRFVSYNHFCNNNLARFYQPVIYNKNIWNKTKYHSKYRYRNNRVYNYGIDRDIIERNSNRKVRNVNIEISNSIAPSKSRKRNSERVISYRPTESRKNNAKMEIKKSSNRSSIRKDKIETSRNNVKSREKIDRITTSRNYEKYYENRTRTVKQESKKREIAKVEKSVSKRDSKTVKRNASYSETKDTKSRTKVSSSSKAKVRKR